MYHLERIGRIAAAFGVAAFFFSATVMLWRTPNLLLHMDGTLTRTEATLSKARATLDNLDKGTKVWADSAKEQTGAIEDLATDAHGTLSQANAALFTLNDSAHALNEDLGALHGTIDAATGTASQATLSLRTLDESLNGLQPLVADSDKAVSNLNALLEDQNIRNTIANVSGMTEQGNAILTDFRQVADKERADWLKPRPWWRAPLAKGGQLIDIGAAVSRHLP